MFPKSLYKKWLEITKPPSIYKWLASGVPGKTFPFQIPRKGKIPKTTPCEKTVYVWVNSFHSGVVKGDSWGMRNRGMLGFSRTNITATHGEFNHRFIGSFVMNVLPKDIPAYTRRIANLQPNQLPTQHFC